MKRERRESLNFALAEEQVGKTGRRCLLLHKRKVLTISDMNKPVGDGFAEVSLVYSASSSVGTHGSCVLSIRRVGWFILACGGCTSRASLLLTVASESVISLILHEQTSRQMPEGGHDFSKA